MHLVSGHSRTWSHHSTACSTVNVFRAAVPKRAVEPPLPHSRYNASPSPQVAPGCLPRTYLTMAAISCSVIAGACDDASKVSSHRAPSGPASAATVASRAARSPSSQNN